MLQNVTEPIIVHEYHYFVDTAVVVERVMETSQTYSSSFNTSVLPEWPLPYAAIVVPKEEFIVYAENGSFVTASTALRNVSFLFPNTLEQNNGYMHSCCPSIGPMWYTYSLRTQ